MNIRIQFADRNTGEVIVTYLGTFRSPDVAHRFAVDKASKWFADRDIAFVFDAIEK